MELKFKMTNAGCKKIWERHGTHTITIDGKDIEISDESYRNLKEALK